MHQPKAALCFQCRAGRAWAGVGHWRWQRVTTRAENRMKAFYQFTVNGFTMMTFINAAEVTNLSATSYDIIYKALAQFHDAIKLWCRSFPLTTWIHEIKFLRQILFLFCKIFAKWVGITCLHVCAFQSIRVLAVHCWKKESRSHCIIGHSQKKRKLPLCAPEMKMGQSNLYLHIDST